MSWKSLTYGFEGEVKWSDSLIDSNLIQETGLDKLTR